MTSDKECVNRITRFLVEDEYVSKHVHNLAQRSLGWHPQTEEDETHPQYERYWDLVTINLMQLATEAVSNLYTNTFEEA